MTETRTMTDNAESDVHALRRRLAEDLAPAERERVLAAIRRLERAGGDTPEQQPADGGDQVPPGFHQVQPKQKRGLPPRGRAPGASSAKDTNTERHARYVQRLRREKGIIGVHVLVPEHRKADIQTLARLLKEDPDREIDWSRIEDGPD
jgi:plasmid stabilization system protein ParE